MVHTETSVWNGSIDPVVRRNTEDHDLIVVDLCGGPVAPHRACLFASGTAQARVLAEKLLRVGTELLALADAIDAETTAADAELRTRAALLAQRMKAGLERLRSHERSVAR